MTDYYLTDKSRLNGQPKRTIADYVESQGILVPRRFDTLKEARASGLPILCRSEHEQEYDGVSGLLDSPDLSRFADTNDEVELKEKIIGTELPVEAYCFLLGLDETIFRNEISFSFWEKLGGYNRTVVADSSIQGRYHIMTNKKTTIDKSAEVNYTVLDNGNIYSFNEDLPTELQLGITNLAALYEKIRGLDHFNSQHCPIMEFQTIEAKNYFLQYHRSRDFLPATFDITAPPPGFSESFFVRGATESKEGRNYKVTVAYPFFVKGQGYKAWSLLKQEDASTEGIKGDVFSEIMTRRRAAQIIFGEDTDFILTKAACNHVDRSKWFKPAISLALKREDVFREGERLQLVKVAKETGENQTINLWIVSDGRKAYVKRV